MKIIEIQALSNGAHRNQINSGIFPVPDGYALIPDDMPIPDTFPFVDLEVEGDSPPVVTSMTAGVVPPPEPEPEPELGKGPENELEQLRAEVATLQATSAPVIAAATAYALTATQIPDVQALSMASLFPTWEDVLSTGAELAAGRIISSDGQLYRVVQATVPQAHQVPGGEGMLAIYRPIDREHAGTADDPIPWVFGMDCLAGVYYSYNGAVYRVADGGNMIPCVWAPDTPGLWQWEKIEEVS